MILNPHSNYTPPPPQPKIYGAEWDGSTSTKWTRTDLAADFADPSPAVNNGTGSSPFDDLYPWSGMEIVEDDVAGTLVAIPKYWYKWTRTGNAMKLQISADQQEGFHVSPAHADRGDGAGERDVVYVGRYHCGSNYKSSAGNIPVNDISLETARNNIHALGSSVWQYDFAMYWTIMMLYLVEFADWDSQRAIGFGGSPSGSMFNVGLTDAMPYHTGTSSVDKETAGCCQYRHIEGLWDNIFDFTDGVCIDTTGIYCIKNPGEFSDVNARVYVGESPVSGMPLPYAPIVSWTNPTASGFEYALFPIDANRSDLDSNIGDDVIMSISKPIIGTGNPTGVISFGSIANNDAYDTYAYSYGAFSMIAIKVEETNTWIGCRLMKLP